MKRMVLVFNLLSLSAYAGLTTSVSHISFPENNMENIEVFINDGRVYEVDSNNTELLSKIRKAKKTNARVEIGLEEGPINPELLERIKSLNILSAPIETEIQSDNLTPMTNFTPSNVENFSVAKRIFAQLESKTKTFSQCFNRAHIWARQMQKNYGIKSQKILIYYTKRYRKDVDKKWWFHIAPMVTINGDKYVMDREFTREPLIASEWEAIFTGKMRAKRVGPRNYRCKKIDNISEYYDSKNTNFEYCNIQYTSMYYWEPNDMEALDANGTQKTKWVDWEIKAATKEAFRRWRKIYEVYKL